MIRKSTTNPRTTRSSAAVNATVLKPIYPNPNSKKQPPIQIQSLKPNHHNLRQAPHSAIPNLDTATNFLLPSSEFFVVDRDSLILSESDIFQSNLARRTAVEEKSSTNSITSSPMPKSKNPSNFSSVFTEEDDVLEEYSENEKENNKIYASLLDKKIMQKKTENGITSIAGLKPPVNTPLVVENISHVDKQSSNAVADKGLRHFSAKVCAKVEDKGVTTYNEVADELVRDIGLEMGKCDHKNIRRRVYDALNVLMAIDIIRKEKKEIRWLGLPNEAADDLRALESERQLLQERINEKSKNLREILRRCISLKNLIDRNAEIQQSSSTLNTGDKLPLPFILISAARDCHVHCEMLEDRTQYFFEFNTSFQINEDIEIMRLMGLDTGRIERIKSFFPKELVAQVLLLCLNNNNNSINNNINNNSNSNTTPITNGNNSVIQNLMCDPSSINSRSIFAPIINNEDLNLGDLETFSATSTNSSLSSSSSL